MFETLIASGLCFLVNAPGHTIEVSDRCVSSATAMEQTPYTARESAFLAEYRQRHPDSIFTDAEALLSGWVSCGEGAVTASAEASDEFITDADAAELVTMLMQHWEASHRAALSQLCPDLRPVSEIH
ncbi:hypothetical protein [Halomicronema sp. CCY15110]|uniref:hypothetical protein n=1 Tax=Halomicronema sp. CCY15110 TaxID=2767773 RepID=UPI00194EC920|nr:hypothetical protein [Halomicronema sp. CCY15110]